MRRLRTRRLRTRLLSTPIRRRGLVGAGGRLLAGEVPDEPAPLHLESATPGPAIGLRSRRRPAGVPAGAGSPTGGVRVLRVHREVERRLTPGRSRRRSYLVAPWRSANQRLTRDRNACAKQQAIPSWNWPAYSSGGRQLAQRVVYHGVPSEYRAHVWRRDLSGT